MQKKPRAAIPFSAALLVREPSDMPRAKGGLFHAFVLPVEVPDLRRFGLAYGLNALGNTLPVTLTLFYFEFVIQIDGRVLLVYFAAALAFVPLWTYLGNRYGHHGMWRFAILATTVLQTPSAFLGPETAWVFLSISVVVGGRSWLLISPSPRPCRPTWRTWTPAGAAAGTVWPPTMPSDR